jgi:hypothetical protein
LDRVKGCKKLLMAPGVRYFREACCIKEGHCSNMGEGGYRRGMLEDLSKIKEAMVDMCRDTSMRSFKVVGPVELLGIRPGMDALIGILGNDPVHMAAQGYAKLAGSCVSLAESTMTIFTGEKRGWEEGECKEDKLAMENFHRRRHEWLYNAVSGTGSWKGGQGVKPVKLGGTGGLGGQGMGRAAMGAGGGAASGAGKFFPGKAAGPKGGNSYPFPY